MHTTPSFQLLPAAQYYRALAKLIPKARQRIVIHAMVVAWTPGMEQLVPPIEAALRRGVRVDIVGDTYTRLFLPLWAHFGKHTRTTVASWKHTDTIQQHLIRLGATVNYIGALRPTNPFAGRCHSKITIVDDTVFSFGGVNFGDQDLRNAQTNSDYMLTTKSAMLADYLHNLVVNISKDQHVMPNLQHSLTPYTSLLFDGGAPKDSIIYDTACHLAARAQTIYYASQYPPSGRLGYLVAQKHNECYFNRAGMGSFPHNIPFILDTLRYKITNHYHRPAYLHAKCMLTIESDGTKHLITGSNNFSWSGVAFGTKEIALTSTDEQLWQTIFDYIQNDIA